MKNKILISIFVILLLVQMTSAESVVNRTIEGNNFTYVGSVTKNITINLTGNPVGNFLFWGANETLPENMNIIVITGNADVIKKDAKNWSFATINGNTLRYNITSNNSAIPGFYFINGTFKDNENINGIISENMNIHIALDNTANVVTAYDTNGTPGIQKDEVINAIWDYFFYVIPLNDVLSVVRAYLGI